MIETFGKPLADSVRLLTFSTDAVFDEFNFKGRTYLGGYDYYRKSYYVLTAECRKARRSTAGRYDHDYQEQSRKRNRRSTASKWFTTDKSKAGDGNRTHVTSLEGWSFTIKLHPHQNRLANYNHLFALTSPIVLAKSAFRR